MWQKFASAKKNEGSCDKKNILRETLSLIPTLEETTFAGGYNYAGFDPDCKQLNSLYKEGQNAGRAGVRFLAFFARGHATDCPRGPWMAGKGKQGAGDRHDVVLSEVRKWQEKEGKDLMDQKRDGEGKGEEGQILICK